MKFVFALLMVLLPFFAMANEVNRKIYLQIPFSTIHSETDFRGTRLYVTSPVFETFDVVVIDAIEKSGATDLYLSSEGGYIDPAFRLGEYIAEKNITVHVTDYCLSACAFIAIKSKTLQLNSEGFIAFHFPYVPAIPTDSNIQEYGNNVSLATMTTLQYMLSAGYTVEFVLNILLNTDRNSFLVAFTHSNLLTGKNGDGSGLVIKTTDELIEIAKND